MAHLPKLSRYTEVNEFHEATKTKMIKFITGLQQALHVPNVIARLTFQPWTKFMSVLDNLNKKIQDLNQAKIQDLNQAYEDTEVMKNNYVHISNEALKDLQQPKRLKLDEHNNFTVYNPPNGDGNPSDHNKGSQIAGNKKEKVSYHMRFAGYIPDELVFDILVRLPAQDIYFGARLVCRKWYYMIRTKDFIHKHLEYASYGLLYESGSGDVVFISARDDGEGMFDTYKLNYDRGLKHPTWSSCNGLMLGCDVTDKSIYRVTNVLTGQDFCLPPYPYYIYHRLSGIGYDAASMTYKVVVSRWKEYEYECAILTVGVDISWRIIRTDHLSLRGMLNLMHTPIITEGFVHWWRDDDTGVVTLNLETEIIAEIPPPKVEEGNTKSCCLSKGIYLTLFVQRGRLALEVFEMNPKKGKWRKLADICLEGQQRRIQKLWLGYGDAKIKPIGWLKYPEVLALRIGGVVIFFYNLITCEIVGQTMSTYGTKVTVLKNNLLWFGGR